MLRDRIHESKTGRPHRSYQGCVHRNSFDDGAVHANALGALGCQPMERAARLHVAQVRQGSERRRVGVVMRRFPALVTALLAVLMVVVSGTLLAPAASAAPYCGIRWGSLEKVATSAGRSDSGSLVNVRAGRHDCYDRLVLDMAGDGSARVRYVDEVRMDGSGQVVPLRGGAFLEILTGPAYDVQTGASTYRPANPNELVNVTGWGTFRQVADGGSFEGQMTIGLGVRARLPFRVFGLTGPGDGSRLVIDVAHRW